MWGLLFTRSFAALVEDLLQVGGWGWLIIGRMDACLGRWVGWMIDRVVWGAVYGSYMCVRPGRVGSIRSTTNPP